MQAEKITTLFAAFREFIDFAPYRLSLIFGLMLLQSFSIGVGLLLLIPLLHLIGFDFGSNTSSEFAGSISPLIADMGLTLNLPVVLTAYIAIVSFFAYLRYVLSVLSTAVQQAYVCRIRNQLYDALLHSNWQYIIGHKMSDFMHCLTSQVQGIGMASYLMLSLLSQLVLSAVYLLLALALSWQMSVLALACGLLLMLVLLPLNQRILSSGGSQLLGYKSIFQMFSEQLSSLKMIKSYGSEKHYAGQVDRMSRQLEEQQLRLTKFSSLTQLVYMVGAVISFSIFFYFAIEWLSVSLTTLLLLLLIFSRLLPQLSSIQLSYQRLLHQLPAFADVRKMMQASHQAREPSLAGNAEPPVFRDTITLDDISFQYASHNRKVIDHLSLTIKKNSTIALVGPSGAGKSTLADLIAGLLVPDSGRIYCDTILLDDARRMAWRKGVAYITQEVFLFHDTVRANLSWVQPRADEAVLWNMLEMAAAADFVRQLPDGLDTIIGDRGVRLSGGERQRLALARALMSKPQLLLLDEATSALDHENEKKIQSALEHLQGQLTIIIIAHRETTIEHVDATVSLKISPKQPGR